jgi:hypothetical protein
MNLLIASQRIDCRIYGVSQEVSANRLKHGQKEMEHLNRMRRELLKLKESKL